MDSGGASRFAQTDEFFQSDERPCVAGRHLDRPRFVVSGIGNGDVAGDLAVGYGVLRSFDFGREARGEQISRQGRKQMKSRLFAAGFIVFSREDSHFYVLHSLTKGRDESASDKGRLKSSSLSDYFFA